MSTPFDPLHASSIAQLQALSDGQTKIPPLELLRFQTRDAQSEGPAWLELALAVGRPDDNDREATALVAAMMRAGEEYAFWQDPNGNPFRWWAEAPQWHLNRVGSAMLEVLGRSKGIKHEDPPEEARYLAYAESSSLALEWLRERTLFLLPSSDGRAVDPTHTRSDSLSTGRWGLPPQCTGLGPSFEIGLLLAAGPKVGALARLRLQAVHSDGAWLTLAPVPASACLLLDAAFGQMLTDLRDWLRSRLSDHLGLYPLRNIALAWDLTPAVGERIGLDAVSGDSAGAAFTCAALQVLAAHTPPALRAQLALARHRMGSSFMSAAITLQGGLRPVGWVNAKSQAIAPLARWATRNTSPGQARTPLYLADDQTDLDELPACFETKECTTVEALVQTIASSAEHLSRGQQAFLQAWYAPPPHAPTAPACDTGNAPEDPWPLDHGETPYRELTAGPELPESLLNPLVNDRAANPVSTLRQAAMQGVARWQRQAGGRLRHRFVPLSISPDDASRHGIDEHVAARAEPHEHLQTLLAELDHGGHTAYLLTGLPGSGKTVLLRRHMLDLSTRLLQDGALAEAGHEPLEVPIYLPLNRFPSTNPATPTHDPATAEWWATQARAEVIKQLREQGWQAPILAPFMNAAVGADTPGIRWRWHLDGLNELPTPPGQDRGTRARWVVQGFLDAFKPSLKPLLSVRSEHFSHPSWLKVEVKDWEDRHIKAYVRKYFVRQSQTGKDLWDALTKDAALQDLCRRPMHLHMQCELAEAGFSPWVSDRASLYLAYLWLRLKRLLGESGNTEVQDTNIKADEDLSPDDLLKMLTEDDRRKIISLPLNKASANDLRRLPLQGLLVRGLLDQAESQYWQDAEAGRQARERCTVALELDPATLQGLALRQADDQPVRDPKVVRRWLRAAEALGVLQTNELESSLQFSHQSWGEFFASLRLLDTPPDALERQAQAGVPGAQDKWDRAMVRPFRHLHEPVSAESERQALRERVNRRWAQALPLLHSLPLQTLPFVSGRWLGPVPLDEFKADTSINMADASDEAVQQRYAQTRLVNEGAVLFDAPARCVWANLDAWAAVADIPAALGLAPDQRWADEPAAWQALVITRLYSCFKNRVWQHLRAGDGTHPAISEDGERELRELPGHMDLPATNDVQEVFNLALQGLPQNAAEAWLRHWLEQLPHPTPQAWRVLAPAAKALRDRLEPPDGSWRITGLGLWRQPHHLLQHLRRWLLLASTDAGAAARERLRAAGLLAALDAPIPNLPSAIAAAWAAQRAAAYGGEGLDLLLRLQAGLLLGELGDNIRFECCQFPAQGQPERMGIRLRRAFWAAVPASGQGAIHRIGSERYANTKPVWTVPAGALPAMRFAQTPAVVMQWQAYVEDLQARLQKPPALWAMGQSRFSNPLQPITSLDWFSAQAFTDWMAPLHTGLFPDLNGPDEPARLSLPTEMQHEAAVRFDPAKPLNTPTTRQALWPHDPQDARDPRAMPPDLFNHHRTRWGAPAPVGVFSAALTLMGIEAMGNVWTWCSNVYSPNHEGKNAGVAQQLCRAATREEWLAQAQAEGKNPALLALHGGSFSDTADSAMAAYRGHFRPDVGGNIIGLRWQMSRPTF